MPQSRSLAKHLIVLGAMNILESYTCISYILDRTPSSKYPSFNICSWLTWLCLYIRINRCTLIQFFIKNSGYAILKKMEVFCTTGHT